MEIISINLSLNYVKIVFSNSVQFTTLFTINLN